jgi:UDPglucose--hexose-1-phosphate uridylyltransferase
VVVHAPHHVRSFADLARAEIALVATAWERRARAASTDGFPYVHALLNEGRDAGASLPHSHSQLVWLREPPPAVLAEQESLRRDECALCRLVDHERASGSRIVAENEGVVALASYAGRLPYELLIVGEHLGNQDGFAGGAFLERALQLLADSIRRLRAVEGPVPLNAWLHNSGHQHFEVLPRISVLAGLELGAGLYVNTVDPEEAAERLRRAG